MIFSLCLPGHFVPVLFYVKDAIIKPPCYVALLFRTHAPPCGEGPLRSGRKIE